MIHACHPVCQEFKDRHGYIASWKSAWHAHDPASIKINKERHKQQSAVECLMRRMGTVLVAVLRVRGARMKICT